MNIGIGSGKVKIHSARINLEITNVGVGKVLAEPGPELLGYATRHVRLRTTAAGKASILVKKFRYSLEIIDDVWIVPQLEIHPIEKLDPSKLSEETFRMPSCEKVSRKEMKETAKEMLKDVVN